MSGQFTFEKSDAPGSGSTTMFKAKDRTGKYVPYLLGMELLAADTEDGVLFRSQLLKVNFPPESSLHPPGERLHFLDASGVAEQGLFLRNATCDEVNSLWSSLRVHSQQSQGTRERQSGSGGICSTLYKMVRRKMHTISIHTLTSNLHPRSHALQHFRRL